jgi:peptidoglycan hydrolase-like protein with peptidoglycan-binding domain
MPSHAHHAMSSKHVKAIQAALNQNGAQLNVDGRWGPKTRSALMDFQQKNGLKATGHADKATLDKLNVSM